MSRALRDIDNHNEWLEIERQFVGEVILCEDDQLAQRAISAVPAKMFADEYCRTTITAIKKGVVRDVFSIWKAVNEEAPFSYGDKASFWLADTIDRVIDKTGRNLIERCHQIVHHYKARSANQLADKLKGADTKDVDAALRECEEVIANLRAEGAQDKVSMPELMANLVHDLETGKRHKNLPECGIQQIDSWIGGFGPGTNTVVGALTSVGKSAFVQRMALKCAYRGHKVLLFTCEMTEESVAERFLVMGSKKSHDTLQNPGTWSQADRDAIVSAMNDIANLPIEIVYCPGWSVEQIEQYAIESNGTERIGLMTVDYLQLLGLEERTGSSEERLSRVAQRIRDLGGQLNVPTISVVQLNDMAEDTDFPDLKSIRGSRAIGQHADNVILISRNKQNKDARVYFTVAKNRNGPLGNVSVQYRPQCYEFVAGTGYDVEPTKPRKPEAERAGF